MISRSRKKHRITAPTRARWIRISLSLALATGATFAGSDAFAQSANRPATSTSAPGGQLRPVPKYQGAPARDPNRAASGQAASSSQLLWRTSQQLPPASRPSQPKPSAPRGVSQASFPAGQAAGGKAPAVQTLSAASPDRSTDSTAMELTSPTGDSAVAIAAQVDAPANRSVRQTQFELPPTPPSQFAPPKPQAAPEPELEASPAQTTPRQADPDFFNNPFGDEDPPAASKGAVPQTVAPQAAAPQNVAPQDITPQGTVPQGVDAISLPSPLEAPAVPTAPATPIDTPTLNVPVPQSSQPEPASPPNILRESAPASQPKPEPKPETKLPELVPVPAPRALPESSRVVPVDPTADAPARSIPDPKPADLPEPSLRVPPASPNLQPPALDPQRLAPPAQPRRPGNNEGFDPDPADVPLFQDLPGGERAPGTADRANDDRIRREVEDFDRRTRDGKEDKPDFPERSLKGESSDVKLASFSCDDFRKGIAAATIRNVSLDISPPFRPDIIEKDEFEKLRNRFKEKQKIRDWTSANGKKLGRGRLHDLAYEKVLVESEFGTIEELPVSELSEIDLAYVTSQWGLPQECLIEQQEYVPRKWIPSKVTWKASNLVHNPLYFEQVNLERYGQTVGPVLEPVISSAHFFANIAVMPYKMGVHLPYECQYPLGYYRPGDCAPWIIPPVPLSLRGAIFQAGAVAGTFWAIP